MGELSKFLKRDSEKLYLGPYLGQNILRQQKRELFAYCLCNDGHKKTTNALKNIVTGCH